jgi:hypothetical protein
LFVRICDPNSGEYRTEDILGVKQKDRTPFSCHFSPQAGKSEIAAQFAQRVAVTPKPDAKRDVVKEKDDKNVTPDGAVRKTFGNNELKYNYKEGMT